MTPNPVLARLVRNNWVENRHRGAFCVVNAQGGIVAGAGDVDAAIFPRSAIKSMQALAMFRSGAVEKFALGPREIALACASHHGEAAHITGVENLLEKIGCSKSDLECGAHPPFDRASRDAMREARLAPGPVHNNCSGKHAGMLAVARALGVPLRGYCGLDHPVQKLVRTCIEDLIGEELSTGRCGTDGCSIPTFAAPLRAFAYGFARMGSGSALDRQTAIAMQQIIAAVTSNPFLVGGTGAFDTEAMQVFDGALMSKLGAEGVYCGAIPALGLGYALKCDDGNKAAAQTMVASLLLTIARPEAGAREFLQKRARRTLRNWRNLEVATLEALPAATPKI